MKPNKGCVLVPLSIATIKHSDKKQFKDARVCFGSEFKDTAQGGGQSQQQELVTSSAWNKD